MNSLLAGVMTAGYGGGLVFLWAVASLVDELSEVAKGFEDWLAESLNVFEVLSYSLLVIGLG